MVAPMQQHLQRGYAALAPGSHHSWPVPLLPASISLPTHGIPVVAKGARFAWEERLHEAVSWAESLRANITDFHPETHATSNETHQDGYLDPNFRRRQTNPISLFEGKQKYNGDE